VLLAAALDDMQFREAVRLGAAGVVLKEMAPERLVEAVRAVAAGGQWIDPAMLARLLRSPRDMVPAPPEALTPRETEIVRMVASGLRNRAIAERLEIGEGTVKMHLHNIYEKLQIDGRVALTLRAQRLGLV
jgi:DNA-binding NarL/FixJ family response regulator